MRPNCTEARNVGFISVTLTPIGWMSRLAFYYPQMATAFEMEDFLDYLTDAI